MYDIILFFHIFLIFLNHDLFLFVILSLLPLLFPFISRKPLLIFLSLSSIIMRIYLTMMTGHGLDFNL